MSAPIPGIRTTTVGLVAGQLGAGRNAVVPSTMERGAAAGRVTTPAGLSTHQPGSTAARRPSSTAVAQCSQPGPHAVRRTGGERVRRPDVLRLPREVTELRREQPARVEPVRDQRQPGRRAGHHAARARRTGAAPAARRAPPPPAAGPAPRPAGRRPGRTAAPSRAAASGPDGPAELVVVTRHQPAGREHVQPGQHLPRRGRPARRPGRPGPRSPAAPPAPPDR